MKYQKLMQQPNNILFFEDDIDSSAIFQKVETVEKDIVVRAFNSDFEQFRLGLREMDDTTKNSKDYQVFDREQLETMNEFFTLAYLQG